MLEARQKLVFLVIEFSTPIYANVVSDCHKLLGQKVFNKVIFNRVCKCPQYF